MLYIHTPNNNKDLIVYYIVYNIYSLLLYKKHPIIIQVEIFNGLLPNKYIRIILLAIIRIYISRSRVVSRAPRILRLYLRDFNITSKGLR